MNKWALSFLCAFLSCAGIAAAQPYVCSATAGVPPNLRPEGVAEYVSDVVITCTGGSFYTGSPTDIGIFLNANITSRAAGSNSEATLLLDEAAPNNRSLGYNIFRGSQVSANSIRFNNVIVNAPGPNNTRKYRISNIRVDTSQLPPGAAIQAFISPSSSAALPVTPSTVTVGFVGQPQSFDVRSCDDSQASFTNFLQTASQNPALASGLATTGTIGFNVRFRGGSVGAFRRSIAPEQDPFSVGIQYNSESDFVDTEILGPISGVATQGTRLMSRFDHIPAGVRLFVTTAQLGPGGASSATITANLVSTDANGAGPANAVSPAGIGTCSSSGASQFIAELPIVAGTAQAVWEVTSSSPDAIEKLSFGVAVVYVSTPALPALGTVSATGRLGPISTVGSASATAPAPRFAGSPTTLPAFSMGGTATAVTITTANPLPGGQVGTPYSLPSFAASGGTSPYSWSVAQGSSLPPGLTLLSNGAFSGNPTTQGAYSFTIQVTDHTNGVATKFFSIDIASATSGPVITTASPLPPGQVGSSYSPVMFAAAGITPPLTWTAPVSSLPPGLTFTSAGVLSGTPTSHGTYNFNVTVMNSSQQQANKQFSILINPAPAINITITPATLPTGITGNTYSQLLTATGGVGPYTFALASGSLPSGLSLSSGGIVSGTLTAAGSSSFTIQATDSQAHTGSQGYSVGITAPPVVTPPIVDTGVSITTKSLPNGTVGTDYTPSLAATGGIVPYTWSADIRTLPPGVTLSTSGVFSGKPTVAGSFRISVRVADIVGNSDGTVYPMTVTGPPISITTTSLANATIAVSYSGSVQATGGVPPYAFSVITGSLPAGLSLAADGTITGTPTAAGTSNFTVQVTDAALNPQGKSTRALSITVAANPLAITTTSLAGGILNLPYTASVAASGGTLPYTFSVASGSLPSGLSLNAAGNITGTPTSLGDFNVTIQVTDKQNQNANKAFPLKIVASPSITTNSPLGILITGTASTLTLAATGGTLPYAWSITGGSLPSGLSLDPASGAINGTPTAAGAYSFTATVTDANKLTATKASTGRVTTPVRITTTSPLPAAAVGTAYSQKIDATGGTIPYRFSADTLPEGLSIDASGLISGTPTATGGAFTLTATDADNLTATGRFTLAVNLPQLSGVTIGGVTDTPPPATQPRVTLTLGSAFPVAITGTVVLTFASDANVPADDPAIQFSNGTRTAAFTIPAGSTQATFTPADLAIQTGTVSGLITLTSTLQSASGPVTCNCPLNRNIRVAKSVPVITTFRAARISGGITLTIIGFSTTRELTQAVVQFTVSAGGNVPTTSFTIPVSTAAASWFTSAASTQFGSQFSLPIPFTISGDPNVITSVSVTLSNTQGTSTASTAPVQ
jgi:hypothetical protein